MGRRPSSPRRLANPVQQKPTADHAGLLVASLDVSDSGEVVQPLEFDQPISGYSRIYVVNHEGEISEILMAQNGPLPPTAAPIQRH